MANAAAVPVSLLEQLGVNILQHAADQSLGSGVLTFSARTIPDWPWVSS